MQTPKVKFDGHGRWLSPWYVVIFMVGAVVGAILSPRYGPIYTSAAMIVTCWLAALLLIAFDQRIPMPRIASSGRRDGLSRKGADAGNKGKAPQLRRGPARGLPSSLDSRRARLRPIAGGKSESP